MSAQPIRIPQTTLGGVLSRTLKPVIVACLFWPVAVLSFCAP